LTKGPEATKINLKFWRQVFTGVKLPAEAPDYILLAQAMVDRANLTKEELDMISAQDKALRDYNSAMDFKWDDGFAKGEAKRNLEVARRLLSQGVDPTIVASATNLDLETLKDLQAQTQ
jgi:predicted transposase/invertase (TIGR01784 family)